MNLNRNLAAFAGFNGAMGVAVGAFAAHGAGPAIKTLLTTGGHYQLVHAVLALVCATLSQNRLFGLAGWLASLGGLVFCLSLSVIALLSLPAMGAVAPIGGLLMIAGWLLLIFAAFRNPSTST
ncbi:DUF423 domain-containing protein [soil metagenome]